MMEKKTKTIICKKNKNDPFEIYDEEQTSFNKFVSKIVEEYNKQEPNCFFFKDDCFCSYLPIEDLLILPSSNCGDDSISDSLQIHKDLVEYVQTNFKVDLKNVSFFHEMDGKEYINFNNLIINKKLITKPMLGLFHTEVNIDKAIMMKLYNYPLKFFAKTIDIDNDFSSVLDIEICKVRKLSAIFPFFVLHQVFETFKILEPKQEIKFDNIVQLSEKIYKKLEKWKTLTFSNEFVFDEKLISFFNEHVEKNTKDLKNICRLNECKVTGAKYKLISNI
jgi:hypothetical protein